jgi:hypothetical protein
MRLARSLVAKTMCTWLRTYELGIVSSPEGDSYHINLPPRHFRAGLQFVPSFGLFMRDGEVERGLRPLFIWQNGARWAEISPPPPQATEDRVLRVGMTVRMPALMCWAKVWRPSGALESAPLEIVLPSHFPK